MNMNKNSKLKFSTKIMYVLLLTGLFFGVLLPLTYLEFSDRTLLTAPIGYKESIIRQLIGGFIVLAVDFIVLLNIWIQLKDLKALFGQYARTRQHD
jgi:hypothetical protein